MSIIRPLAEIHAPSGTLARLAPGALLLLAITGTNVDAAGDGWHFSTVTVAHTQTTLTDTIARVVGLTQSSDVHTTIVCGGLALHKRPALDLTLVRETRPNLTMLLNAEVSRGEELRFIIGGIDPPLLTWNHG